MEYVKTACITYSHVVQYSNVGLKVSTPLHANVLDVDPSLNVQPLSHAMDTVSCVLEVIVPLTGFIFAMCPVDWSDSEGSVHTPKTMLHTCKYVGPKGGSSVLYIA